MSAVEQMSRDALEEQLRLCHEHFRRCLRALKGDGLVEPVELAYDDSLGDSDDLELFYACKKASEVLAKRKKTVV